MRNAFEVSIPYWQEKNCRFEQTVGSIKFVVVRQVPSADVRISYLLEIYVLIGNRGWKPIILNILKNEHEACGSFKTQRISNRDSVEYDDTFKYGTFSQIVLI